MPFFGVSWQFTLAVLAKGFIHATEIRVFFFTTYCCFGYVVPDDGICLLVTGKLPLAVLAKRGYMYSCY